MTTCPWLRPTASASTPRARCGSPIPIGARVFRVREGGEVTDSIAFTDAIPVACVLGGADRRTLFMCAAADWKRDAIAGRRTGRIDACEVDVAGAGRP